MKRLLIFGLVFLLTFGNLPGQQSPVTFTANTTLVIIDVTVKDKLGKVVEDLKKNDFVLSEDGKTQQIAVFDFQKLDIDTAPPVPATKPAAAPPAAGIGAAVVQTAQPAPAAVKAAPAAPPPAQPGVAT